MITILSIELDTLNKKFAYLGDVIINVFPLIGRQRTVSLQDLTVVMQLPIDNNLKRINQLFMAHMQWKQFHYLQITNFNAS